ncbi:hypothetical protein V8E51_012111 [Hyaloscypha variabilis]
MGLIRKTISTLLLSGAGGAGGFAFWTRNSRFVPIASDDPIFSSAAYLRNNPNKNPQTKDLCVRRVPLAKIKPQLLEKEGEGYAYQRRYLEKKYRNDTTTAHQLWDTRELLESPYDVGTQITDHFEVVSKTPSSIVVRCGDSPLKTAVRDSDGLFEMGVEIKRDEGVAEFRLKSVFYKGLGKADAAPMPSHVEFAHRLYTKLWMESAVRNVVL